MRVELRSRPVVVLVPDVDTPFLLAHVALNPSPLCLDTGTRSTRLGPAAGELWQRGRTASSCPGHMSRPGWGRGWRNPRVGPGRRGASWRQVALRRYGLAGPGPRLGLGGHRRGGGGVFRCKAGRRRGHAGVRGVAAAASARPGQARREIRGGERCSPEMLWPTKRGGAGRGGRRLGLCRK